MVEVGRGMSCQPVTISAVQIPSFPRLFCWQAIPAREYDRCRRVGWTAHIKTVNHIPGSFVKQHTAIQLEEITLLPLPVPATRLPPSAPSPSLFPPCSPSSASPSASYPSPASDPPAKAHHHQPHNPLQQPGIMVWHGISLSCGVMTAWFNGESE